MCSNYGLKSTTNPADSKEMDLSAIAIQGLQQADAQLETAAAGIASAASPDGSNDGTNLDVVDLSSEMVALMAAKNEFLVNLTTLKTADDIQKSVIDLTA